MKLIKQSFEVHPINFEEALKSIERTARTCYKSFDKITEDSHKDFIKRLIERGHEAMLEFADLTVTFVTNRGISHELVRHRLASFAQESTRYVNYRLSGIHFILPEWWEDSTDEQTRIFYEQLKSAEKAYMDLIAEGWSPQQAREVLPNALRTKIVVKANFREWRHILKLRTDKTAHPQMKALMSDLASYLKQECPIVFSI